MVNLLPAILIGGPPHSGKSVLFYSLTKSLYERGVKHHIIRACDGEGNWFQEIHRTLDQDTVRLILKKSKVDWTPTFVDGMCRDLDRRHSPMLVDMGGRPKEWQTCILQNCTHSLLLLRNDDDESVHFWQQLVCSTDLLPLAELQSIQYGSSVLQMETPVVQGTLAGLERGTLAHGPVFDALVERIAALFSTYSLEELEQTQVQNAPTDLAIHLPQLLRTFDPLTNEWKPAMLRLLADELPLHTPMAIFGRGPGWLYAALAAQVGELPFYQFDPRIGWIAPPTLELSSQSASEAIAVHLDYGQNEQVLSVRLTNEYLDYLQAEGLPFSPVATERGLIINGKMPLWLLTALVRLYSKVGVPWIACYQPQIEGAVVVHSQTDEISIGDVITMPMPL